MKKIGIGIDDFKKIREGDYYFVDKTDFIKDIIDDGSEVALFPRPRRFGKTSNLSMLSYFFDIKENSKELFKGLKITKYDGNYLEHMNKYPVIFLTLKDCKVRTYKEFIDYYKEVISNLYKQFSFILKSDLIYPNDKAYFERCQNGEENKKLELAISKLCMMLETYYNEKVIILLDEYDAPIIGSYLNGFYEKCINFMREVFSTTFKGNLSLQKGVITGILRISKEGMFSGANNIKVYNITDFKFANSFGFTEGDLINILFDFDLIERYLDIKRWYDGYEFSLYTIYNPWSILSYLADTFHRFDVYWSNTGGTDLLEELIYNKNNPGLLEEFHKLLETGVVKDVYIDYNMDLRCLNGNRNTIWTLFMMAGYLTIIEDGGELLEKTNLRITNYEISKNLKKICERWFQRCIKSYGLIDEDLINNNMEDFKDIFTKIIEESFSYYDVDKRNGENFYHAFIMGLLYSNSSKFQITSNREVGYGRYYLLLKPINDSCNNAYIIEFKSIEKNSFDKTIKAAFKQIEEKKYDAELKEYHVTKIAIAFKGKDIKIAIK